MNGQKQNGQTDKPMTDEQAIEGLMDRRVNKGTDGQTERQMEKRKPGQMEDALRG